MHPSLTHYPVLLGITKDGMKSKKGVYVGGYTIALFYCTSAHVARMSGT